MPPEQISGHSHLINRNGTLSNRSNQLLISPSTSTLNSGQTLQFTATLPNFSQPAVTWSSSSGSISNSGLFTAPTVSTPQTATITVASLNSSLQGSVQVSVQPSDEGPSLETAYLPAGTLGVSYSFTLAGHGGQLPYQWSILSGSLPKGLQLGAGSGIISGVPSLAGNFSFEVRLQDAAGRSATHTFSIMVSTGDGCGPPTYNCSRFDLEIVQVPAVVPSVGNLSGANKLVTDPNFSNRIVRVTDAYTNPTFQYRTFSANSGGSANENGWNTNSTMFWIADTGSLIYPMTFDPSSMQASRMYSVTYASTGGLVISGASSGQWSWVDPNWFYVLAGTQILKYDFSNQCPSCSPPAPTVVYDFTTANPNNPSQHNCLPAGFTPIWSQFGGLSKGDESFVAGYSDTGIQGTGVYAVIYTADKGCTMLNTSTGRITSDWSASGTINIPDRFYLHDVVATKTSSWIILPTEGCIKNCGSSSNPYFWQLNTTTVTQCLNAKCGGHWTVGYDAWQNNDGDPLAQYHARAFADLFLTTPTIAEANLPQGIVNLDQHPSWNNADPSDSYPFISSTYSTITPFPTAWYNEIIGISPSNGTVVRFAHNFITAKNAAFDPQQGIGVASQDGRFFLFSSDWMGKLGSVSGSSSCSITSTCRGDAFIVELR